MALETYSYDDGKGVRKNRLVACPLCGHEFGWKEPRWKHFLDEHGPEDAGLSPIGESPQDTDRPLFAGFEEGST